MKNPKKPEDTNSSLNLTRSFKKLFLMFFILIVATYAFVVKITSAQLKDQLVDRCYSLAVTVSAFLAEDSEDYKDFIETRNTDTDYYKRTKATMVRLKQINKNNVNCLYTAVSAESGAVMYILDGEDPSGETHSPPGRTAAMTDRERAVYSEGKTYIGDTFAKTETSRRLSVYEPIIHQETGEFLGMAVVSVDRSQFRAVMSMFSIQCWISLLAGLIIFAVTSRRMSGITRMLVNKKILEANEAERRLVLENETLDRINKLKTDLMTTISHEARTPLAVLAGYASLVSIEMRDKCVDEQITADLDSIVSEAARVANLIDSMKHLAVNSSDTAEYVKLDLSGVIRQIAGMYRPILERDGIGLNMNLEDGMFVYGNQDELTQVCFNILQNAKKHTRQGSVDVSSAKENGLVKITISDSGTGIPPELFPRIFERGVTTRPDGLGVGLAVSKEIMDKHNGTIRIVNNSEAGVTVTLELPEYSADELSSQENY